MIKKFTSCAAIDIFSINLIFSVSFKCYRIPLSMKQLEILSLAILVLRIRIKPVSIGIFCVLYKLRFTVKGLILKVCHKRSLKKFLYCS